MSSCGAILLAGGQSRRMGRDKALLPFGTEVLAERLYRMLAATCSEVVVVRDPARGFPVPGARLVADRHPDRGPMEAVATGLEQIRADRAIVVACDMPFVTEGVVRFLQDFDPGACLVVPRTDRGLEPLMAVYARDLAPELRRLLAAGERRLRVITERIPFRELPVALLADLDPEGRAFRNLNHPEAYQAAIRDLASE